MQRTFVTYAPYWSPPKTRRQLLQSYETRFFWEKLISVFLGMPSSVVKEYYPEITQFLLAYVRDGGKFNFQTDESEWNFRHAIRYVDTLTAEFIRCSWGPPHQQSMPLREFLKMDIIPIGIKRKTRLFKHTWLAMQINLSMDSLLQLISQFSSEMHKRLQFRQEDPKFGFITKDTKLPHTLQEYADLPDMMLGIVFELLVKLLGDRTRWALKTLRNIRLGELLSAAGNLAFMQPFMLADLRIRYVVSHENSTQFKQLQELEKQAELMRPQRARGPNMWFTNKLPGTVIAQIDAILQEVPDEALHQRQQRKVRESAASNPEA